MVKVILSTSVIFLAIVAVRKFFRAKAGNVFLYSLWLLFAAGLVVPVFVTVLQDIGNWEAVRLESPASIMNLVKITPFPAGRPDTSVKQIEEPAAKGEKSKNQGDKSQKRNTNSQKRIRETASNVGLSGWMELPLLRYLLFFIWAAGATAILTCQILSEKTFRRQLVENRMEASFHGQKAYIAAGIKTPLLFRGKGLSSEIYLPEMVIENETLARHAILHESVHRKHGDIWWGYLRNVLVAAYWFYPLAWAAAVLSKRDCEYACDSAVMKNMDRKERISYGNSLLSFVSVGGKQDLFCTATAMKAGRSELEVRIRMIKSGRKRSIFATAIVLLLLCATGFVAFTDAMDTDKEPVQASQMPSSQPEPVQTFSAKNAEFELDDIWGADPPHIYYEDDKSMIFAGYFGLFAYSKETGEIVQSLDLKEIGCNATQGDHYCKIDVSEDGKTVYLHVVRDEKMYQYSIDTMELQYLDYKLPAKRYDREKWEKAHKSGILCKGSTIGDLVYWYDNGGNTIKYEPLFYRPYGHCDFFGPENIQGLSEVSFYVVGKVYIITEREKLKWIEKHFSNSAEKIKGVPACPFQQAMYLKRKDGSCGKIFPATDSCPIYQVEDAFYDYKEKDNEMFWKLFGIENMDIFR